MYPDDNDNNNKVRDGAATENERRTKRLSLRLRLSLSLYNLRRTLYSCTADRNSSDEEALALIGFSEAIAKINFETGIRVQLASTQTCSRQLARLAMAYCSDIEMGTKARAREWRMDAYKRINSQRFPAGHRERTACTSSSPPMPMSTPLSCETRHHQLQVQSAEYVMRRENQSSISHTGEAPLNPQMRFEAECV